MVTTGAGDTAYEGEGAVPEGLPDYAEAVLDVADAIPEGRVLAYGDVAEILGSGGPRQVGSVMSRYGSATSWWRVIRASGEPPPGLEDEAIAHYRAEGTPLVGGLLTGRRVDMRRARWEGPAPGSGGGRPAAGP